MMVMGRMGRKKVRKRVEEREGSGSLIGTGGQGQSFNDCPGWIRWKDGDGNNDNGDDGDGNNDNDGDSDGDDDNDDGGGTTCRSSMIASDCWGRIM